MVDVAPKIKDSGEVRNFTWHFFEVTVDTDDTVTFGTIATITAAYIVQKDDCATVVTFTKATNVLTITQAVLTDEQIQGVVWGTPSS